MRRLVTFLILATAASAACHDAAGPADDVRSAGAGPVLASSEGSERSQAAQLDLREARASLTAAGDALSDAIQQDGIVSALGDAFDDDVLFLSPRVATIQGSAAANTFLTTNALAPTDMRWRVIIAQVSGDGTQGYTWASGFTTINLGAGSSELPNLFLIYWRRAEGGDWKVAALVFNLRAGEPAIPEGFGTPTNKHRRNFPNTEPAEQRAEVLAVDADFSATSVSTSSGPAFEAFAAPNAVGVNGGVFVFGPSDIGEAFSIGPNDLISWIPRFSDVAASGDLGFTVGDATFVFEEFGTFFSKYLTVWEKQNAGEWKFVADFGSSRPGP